MSISAPATLPIATLPEVRQLIDSAARTLGSEQKGAPSTAVIGIRARLEWAGATELTHDGTPVLVRLCPSALAVREALRERGNGTWLVIITDRDEADLGTGILAHLLGQVLRNPDPWNAVREQFAADRIDRRLVTHPRARELAAGFLAARGADSWLPARGGLLTFDHALGSVVGRWCELGHATDPLIEDVLRWSAKESQLARMDDLRREAGDVIADAALAWLAARCGQAQRLVAAVLAGQRTAQLVPLGLAARAVLAGQKGSASWALLEVSGVGVDDVTAVELTALVEAAERVVRDLILDDNDTSRRQVGHLLHQADDLVTTLRAEAGITSSLLLHGSLTSRLSDLGTALAAAVDTVATRASADGVDAPLADASRLASVDDALGRVQEHLLAKRSKEVRVPRAIAAVRLVRWLALDLRPAAGQAEARRDLPSLMDRHRDADAWVDRAYADVWRGVDEPTLSAAFASVIEAVRMRRHQHDLDFADALAAFTELPSPLPEGVVLIEDLIADVVAPVARERAVLLIVADGMSAAVATEIVDDIEGQYDAWTECLPGEQRRRTTAVSVLPSLTEASRCSLLSGTLTTGQQNAERSGFADLSRAHGLTSALFHKLHLETSGAGHDLAPDVRAAVDDVDGLAVVACVLNTIDDALDRSDPGQDWTTDAVAHLVPLMERARRAGRIVVLTSDHGHIVERREGQQRSTPVTSSNRSKPYAGSPAEAGEVRVRGHRVLMHDHDALLAVDEQVRYGPLKAGYHGGAAPAEVVIPVHVLTPSSPPTGWHQAAPQAPDWWHGTASALAAAPVAGSTEPTVLPTSALPTLFDEIDAPTPVSAGDDLAARVVASPAYRAQRERATRVPISDERVEMLLRLLLASPGNRIDPTAAAGALGVARGQLAGAVPTLQRLLNIEQYPVLERDADGQTLLLNVPLLLEQFGVTS